MRSTLLLAVAGLYAVACASSSPAPSRDARRSGGACPAGCSAKVGGASPAAPKVAQASTAQFDAEAFRKDLEDAYTHILARADKPAPNTPVVDLEAAASIPIPQHRTIDSAVRLFSVDMKDSIQASLIRSARYKNLIDKALADEKLPKGLAYLPVIESAYMPTLTSRAGAHGIWQFMPDTAREYGLRVDWWVDERADPSLSTRAAAAYLRDLYRQFDDWALTLAAYNAGPGRVRRALENSGATTFWELLEQQALPKETRGYVPTFFATLLIASDPQTYGFELGKPADFEDKKVDIEGPVSLRYLAEVAGVDEELLRDLNPAFRRGILPPGRASVRVPAKAAEPLVARAKTLRNEDAYVEMCSYTLRDGDSLKRLARVVGTKPEILQAINEIDGAGRGDTIYLPVRARELGSLLAHSEDRDVFYAVKKGDTLYSVAKRHGLTVAELRDLNDLSSKSTLKPGQRLRILASRTLSAGGM